MAIKSLEERGLLRIEGMTAEYGHRRDLLPLISILLLLSILLVGGCTDLLWGTPQAAFTCSHSSCYPYQQVEFDASGCSSEKDEIAEYSWTFGDGASASGIKVQYTFTNPGDYAICLTITTEHGQEASVTHTVHVAAGLVVPALYPTIQAAIDAAKNGDVIVVLPGTYNENLRFRGGNITVQSTDPDDGDTVSATIIRGNEPGRPIVNFGEGSRSTLAGFTIQGGGASIPCPPCAGGINIREASPMICGNHITDHPNGAISIIESNAQIVDNLITNNAKASPGAAIYANCYYVAPTITGNTFENNTAPSGGAIFITATTLNLSPACAAETIVWNNIFRNNVATKYGGGAIFVEYTGNLKLDTPDSNTYSGSDPDDIFYVVPPSE